MRDLKTDLASLGKVNLFNMKKEIKALSEILSNHEKIVSAAEGTEKLTVYPVVLTNQRLLTVKNQRFKDVEVQQFDIDLIQNLQADMGKVNILLNFKYLNEDNTIALSFSKKSEAFALHMQETFGSEKGSLVKSIDKKGKPSLSLNILNGKEALGLKASSYKIFQEQPGFVRFEADFKPTKEQYKFIGWDRIENIKKNAWWEVAGWSFMGGGAYGTAGAVAGAAAASQGKDKSVANLFLIDASGRKITLVIRCVSKDLEKLSRFLKYELEDSNTLDTDQLVKLKELKDAGVLTEEEFSAKKKQLLNI